MALVQITFDADLSQVGTRREVPDEEALGLVHTGRARFVTDEEPALTTEPEPASEPEVVDLDDDPVAELDPED